MNQQEIKIITKIIREISLFLMLNGFRHYHIETKLDEKTTYFIFRMKNPEPKLIEKMKEKILRERELEVETYGWELVGDIDTQSELEIVGLLIDDMHVETEGETTVITLVRKSRYK